MCFAFEWLISTQFIIFSYGYNNPNTREQYGYSKFFLLDYYHVSFSFKLNTSYNYHGTYKSCFV